MVVIVANKNYQNLLQYPGVCGGKGEGQTSILEETILRNQTALIGILLKNGHKSSGVLENIVASGKTCNLRKLWIYQIFHVR